MRWFCDSDVPQDFSASSDCGRYSICKAHDSTYEAWFNGKHDEDAYISAALCKSKDEAKAVCEKHMRDMR